MEARLAGVAFSALSVSFSVCKTPILFLLRIFEKFLSKYESDAEENADERFNFALAFSNGQRQDVVVDGMNSAEPKKMKLLLDINVLPDRKFEVVSARNLYSSPPRRWGWLPWNRFAQMAAYYLLKLIRIIREILHETSVFLQACSKVNNGSHINGENNRKRISPKKRISRSRFRKFQRYVANLKKIIGFTRTEGIVFDPIEGVADTSLNGSLNNSKLKPVEKRKHPTSSDGDSDYTEDDSNQDDCSGENASSPADTVQEGWVNPDVSSSPEKSPCKNNVNGKRKKDYFEIDEDYKSAEDPDYVPSSHESSSDTEIDEEIQEEERSQLVEELQNDPVSPQY